MHILQETPLGYALLKDKPLELEFLASFKDANEAALAVDTPNLPQTLIDLIRTKKISRIVTSPSLVAGFVAGLSSAGVVSAEISGDLDSTMEREIKQRLPELLGVSVQTLDRSALLLAHAVARKRLQAAALCPDLVVVQGARALDRLDTDINKKCMRIREWHGMHFPEVSESTPDNWEFLVRVAEHLAGGEAGGVSVGGEMDSEDAAVLSAAVEEAKGMFVAREKLQGHLRRRMGEIAPNLTALVGEGLGARLIAAAGSLAELAGKAASTIQVMGAERVLFKALREKGKTPKYGVVFNAVSVGAAPLAAKGRIARTLAAKIALAVRCDAAGECADGSFGRKARATVEARLEDAKSRKPAAKSRHTKGPVGRR
ncbi:nucleolar protein 58 [Nematocida homosporus]|uniref:nucleolar protein 58 n=1 Tax=Nematocida homosporus TaxID=1912981 RepID=UPI002220AA6C|nr:nucleolar protein 58 [Nematocida homosporus]KAI5184781.1 nucleolar protein 58 [Nematocida homosporus]